MVGGAATAAAITALPATRPTNARGATRSVLPDAKAVEASGRPLGDLGVAECAALLQARRISAAELLDACRKRITDRSGPPTSAGSPTAVNAFIRRYDDLAGRLAVAADGRLAVGSRGGEAAPLLCGVPLALKDLYAVAGRPVTASSRVLDGHVAPGDATVWARLKAAGMVLVGHTHTCEFAMYYDTPQTGNPWRLSTSPGGSSGGSGAALAARMVPAATGTDTLGSLRIPAAWCGVSSIKPTFGLVSTAGIIPFVWSLDHAGPMARSVQDCSLLLSQMAGPDPGDASTSVAPEPPATYPSTPRAGAKPLSGTRIGVPASPPDLDPGVAARYANFVGELRALGATVLPLTAPSNPFGATDQLGFLQDALSFHSDWFPKQAERYGPVDQQFLTLISAASTSAQTYLALHRRRATLRDDWRRFLDGQRLDAWCVPVSQIEPPDRSTTRVVAADPVVGRLETYTFNYTGFPVVTVPAGRSPRSGLPVGIQLVGTPYDEAGLLQIGVDLQAHFPHHEEQPGGLA